MTPSRPHRRRDATALGATVLILAVSAFLLRMAVREPVPDSADWLPAGGTSWFRIDAPGGVRAAASLTTAVTAGSADDALTVSPRSRTVVESLAIADPNPLVGISDQFALTPWGNPFVASRILVATDRGIELWGVTISQRRIAFRPRPLLVPVVAVTGQRSVVDMEVLLQSRDPFKDARELEQVRLVSTVTTVDALGCASIRLGIDDPTDPAWSEEVWCPGLGRVSWATNQTGDPATGLTAATGVTGAQARAMAGPPSQAADPAPADPANEDPLPIWRRDMSLTARSNDGEIDTIRTAPSALPLYVQGLVVDAGRRPSGLTAVDSTTGLVRWTLPTAAPPLIQTAGSDGLVAVGDSTGRLTLLQAGSGFVYVTKLIGSPVVAVTVDGGGTATAVGWSGDVVSLRPETAELQLVARGPGQVLGAAPGPGGLAVVAADGSLRLIDPAGRVVSSVTLPRNPSGSLATVGSEIVIGTEDGNLIRWNPVAGTQTEVDARPMRSTRVVVSGGRVLVFDGRAVLSDATAGVLRADGSIVGLPFSVVSATPTASGWVVQTTVGDSISVTTDGAWATVATLAGADALLLAVGDDLWVSDRAGLVVAWGVLR